MFLIISPVYLTGAVHVVVLFVLYRILSDFSSISIHNFRSFRSLCNCFDIVLSQLRSIVQFSSLFRKCLNSSVYFIMILYIKQLTNNQDVGHNF